jgi:hypothetical protein
MRVDTLNDADEVQALDALLDVRELANKLRLRPSWVYDHADDLGAFRLGKYLRFSLPRVMERLESGSVGGSIVGPSTKRPQLKR